MQFDSLDISLCVLMLFVASLYAWHVLQQYIAWGKVPEQTAKPIDRFAFISVVIPFRNEAQQLPSLLQSIAALEYPRDRFEFLLVNDFSEDNGEAIIKAFQAKETSINIRILQQAIEDTASPKKKAISIAVKAAKGSIISTTDADVLLPSKWLHSINAHFLQHDSVLLMGTVLLAEGNNWFERFQSLEFLSIMGMTAGGAYRKKATMCNGANLSYRKEVFATANVYQHNELASGDDVFLLFHLKKTHPNKIHFNRDIEHAVISQAQKSVWDFLQQRKRWASKSTAYTDIDAIYSGAIVLLTNFLFVIASFLMWWKPVYALAFAGVFVLKFIADFSISYRLANYYHKTKLMRYFLAEFLIYSYYVILVAILSLGKTYHWKGRKLQ